jgi:signal transduction histidine kinase
VLEAPDLETLSQLLTRALPAALRVPSVALLVWDRKLDAFEALTPGETRIHPLRPGQTSVAAPETRFLLTDGALLETAGGRGEGVLVPLLARSGLAGMLVLGAPRRSRRTPLGGAESRWLSRIAARAALALENHVYQKELIASERMAALGTMAGMLAHDFRGPMTVIKGYAETLLDDEVPSADVKERARLIVQMVDRLERMTHETLDFARGGLHLARRPMPVLTLLEDLANGISQELPTLTLVRDFQVPHGASGALDVDKLRRAVGNIAANARDAMGGAGRLHLRARIENGADNLPSLVMILADEGAGVSDEIRERIFEPFVTRGKKGGTGLGLPVAKRFVEDHGGSLELLAGAPAAGEPGGARFRLVIPLQARRP